MILDGSKRLLLAGKTGSGKSFLARFLLWLMYRAGYRIVIIDPKIDWMTRKLPDGRQIQLPYGGKGEYKLGNPDHPVLLDDFTFRPELRCMIIHPVVWTDELGQFLKDILYQKNTIIYFDEGTQLVNANFVPIEFLTIVSQGRSKNVGVWYGTQKATRIPEILKSQATYILMLRLAEKDREALIHYMNVEENPALDKALPAWWFWVYDDENDSLTLYRPLKIKKAA